MSTTTNPAAGGGQYRPDAEPHGRRFLLVNLGWIALVTLLVTAGAAVMSWSRTPTYASAAQVQVPPGVVAGTTVAQPVDMGTEKAVASSTAVVQIAARKLHLPVSTLAHGLTVTVPVDTAVLDIKYTGSSPRIAQQRAQAVAEAYVSYRTTRQRADLATAKKANLKGVTVVPAPSPALIDDANLPTKPASPNHLTDLAVAAVIGLALGLGIALVRDRRDDRVRSGADLAARAGARLLGQIPAYRPVGVVGPSRAADAYRAVRARLSRVIATERARTLLVTSASQHATGATAANLAAGLARTGTRTLLVGPAEPFGLPAEPSLGDVLAGTAEVGEAVRHTGIDGLTLLPSGGYGDDDALLDAASLAQVMHELCWRSDLVVLDAPPLPAGPDAELLAAHADLALLVARSRRTHRRQVRQAVDRLTAAGVPLAGCVLDHVGRSRRAEVLHRAPSRGLLPLLRQAIGRRRTTGADAADVPGTAEQGSAPETRAAASSTSDGARTPLVHAFVPGRDGSDRAAGNGRE
ncbi:polysaccharide biosynthesis tyrosine autokinase [Actinocatenispora rupis]|uniref:Capsular polysaccharide biosynthesis protein n=1 Tax=Actinocatenispora rupis TaxID=519421 RepID=A0A8J3J5E5_9ACTN|nr:polysaccharide biosynthesis tyrosine autokinase [Actinocatenispora rupis]GID11926.1 hypothetical protein Aru02nite_28150 [Actinocatenispora rupis]